ncbi:hypothetical protein VF10_25065 [Nostoc linckia z13]|nr:hypothetical protein VF10_25065 [Nostoc linckia z13]
MAYCKVEHKEILKKNTEFRIQNQDALYETLRVACLRAGVRGHGLAALSVGDSDPPLIVRVASPLGRRPPNFQFGGGLKPTYSSASRTKNIAEF